MSTKQAENQEGAGRSVGETLKETQTGGLSVGSVEDILAAAPKDIVEEVVKIDEWTKEDGTVLAVRLRSFTASQSARIRQIGVELRGDRQLVSWAEMEMAQLREGIVEPKFDKKQMHQLYSSSGAGVQRAIKWLDEHSGMDKEEVRKTREEFQGSEE